MARSLFVIGAVAAVSTLSLSVEAHTSMLVPVPKFPDGFYNGNSPYGRINGDKFTSAASIPDYQGVQKIAKVMEGYKTLRQMIMANVVLSTISGHTGNKECALTITTGPKQPIPDAINFPWGHPGPCEAWCDNVRIFYNGNCQGNNVGTIPINKTACAGVNIIQAMYVGVHVSDWEAYSNCAPMEGGTKTDPATLFDDNADGSGASSGSSNDSTGNDADSGSTNSSPNLTPGPSSSDSSSSTSTTPAPTTAPSTSTPSSPSSSSNKCRRRVRD